MGNETIVGVPAQPPALPKSKFEHFIDVWNGQIATPENLTHLEQIGRIALKLFKAFAWAFNMNAKQKEIAGKITDTADTLLNNPPQ